MEEVLLKFQNTIQKFSSKALKIARNGTFLHERILEIVIFVVLCKPKTHVMLVWNLMKFSFSFFCSWKFATHFFSRSANQTSELGI
jgi:hypothetical protein